MEHHLDGLGHRVEAVGDPQETAAAIDRLSPAGAGSIRPAAAGA
jgi:hypothetical protein